MDHFTVAEANANIVKEINVDYLDNVTVHFSKPVTQKVIVRVLYETKTQHGFDNKTRKMRVKVHKGEISRLCFNESKRCYEN